MTRVVAYLRVSTDRQENENQKYGFDFFCDRNRLVITEWVEEKISGNAKMQDRKLNGLMRSLESGDTVIFSEFSRIGRSIYSVFVLLKECIDKGVLIYTIKENFRLTNDIQGKVMSTMLSLIADIERSLTVERIKETYNRKRREADRNQVKVIWGRKLGRKTDMDKRKLEPFREKIIVMRGEGIAKMKIAAKMKVSRITLDKYLKELEEVI
jgi:DNA invertase Pin-like site-specific DNA recombinase